MMKKILRKGKNKTTEYERTLNKLKNKKWIVWALIGFAILAGIGTTIKSVKEIFSVKPTENKKEEIIVSQPIESTPYSLVGMVYGYGDENKAISKAIIEIPEYPHLRGITDDKGKFVIKLKRQPNTPIKFVVSSNTLEIKTEYQQPKWNIDSTFLVVDTFWLEPIVESKKEIWPPPKAIPKTSKKNQAENISSPGAVIVQDVQTNGGIIINTGVNPKKDSIKYD